jgi:(p)ppGpp synthase/HD superfamily hydrolase
VIQNTPLIIKASEFAIKAHDGQVRKYNKAPYITHPARVAKATADLSGATEEMVAAAWLHDVVEDTPVSLETIRQEFGDKAAELVGWLTNEAKVPGENRALRKKKNAERLSKAPKDAQRIKMLDRMDNLGEMDYDQALDFCKVYIQESWDLFHAVANADETLAKRFELVLNEAKLKVGWKEA